MTTQKIQNHWQLDVYKMSVDASMRVFELSKNFPKIEQYSLTDQVRRSSRSVSANIAEAWRRRRYEKAFIDKLNISEAEAAETQVWIEYCVKCDYLEGSAGRELHKLYDDIIGKLVIMINHTDSWVIGK